MKLNYTVNVDINELDFNEPKIPLLTQLKENFFETKKYESFREKVRKVITKDLKAILKKEVSDYVCVDCEASDKESGAYMFSASFDITSQLVLNLKNSNFKLTKQNIQNLETLITEDVMNKLELFEKQYPCACLNDIDVLNWELVS